MTPLFRTVLFSLTPLVALAGAKPEPTPAEPVEQAREVYGKVSWTARHEAILARNKRVKPELVFIGDSITHFWAGEPAAHKVASPAAWKVATGGREATNLGFGFDYIENARWRVAHGELDGISPKVVVVLLGTNNLGHKKDTPEAAAATMSALLKDIQAKQPKAKILLLGVYPRREPNLAEPIRRLNKLYADMAGGAVKFADPGAAVLADKAEGGAAPRANPKYLRDVVHPNAAGYAQVAPLIAEEIEKLLR